MVESYMISAVIVYPAVDKDGRTTMASKQVPTFYLSPKDGIKNEKQAETYARLAILPLGSPVGSTVHIAVTAIESTSKPLDVFPTEVA